MFGKKRRRQPEGVPVGGQFAKEEGATTGFSLVAAHTEAAATGSLDDAVLEAADPSTDPARLTELYLLSVTYEHRVADREARIGDLYTAISENPRTSGVVRRAIGRSRSPLVPAQLRAKILSEQETFSGARRGRVDHHDIALRLARGKAPLSASVLRSGLVHDDDIVNAIEGRDQELWRQMRLTGRLADLPCPGDAVVLAAAKHDLGPEIAENATLTDAQQMTLVQMRQPEIDRGLVRNRRVTSAVLKDLLVDSADPTARERAAWQLVGL